MTRTTYDEIRNGVVLFADSTFTDKLDEFKKTYKLLVNSTRMTSKITTFEELVTVLEKRRCLTEDNVEVLHDIANRLNDTVLLGQVKDYELKKHEKEVTNNEKLRIRHVSRNNPKCAMETVAPVMSYNWKQSEPQKGYAAATVQPGYNPYSYSQRAGFTTSPTAPIYVSRLPPDAIDVISDEMGTKWTAFARLILVKEGEIDDLTSKYNMNIKERVVKCLEIYEKRSLPHDDIKRNLLNALRKVGRADVSERIECMHFGAGF